MGMCRVLQCVCKGCTGICVAYMWCGEASESQCVGSGHEKWQAVKPAMIPSASSRDPAGNREELKATG